MFKYTIDEKPIITNNDNVDIKDLCESIFNFDNNITGDVNIYKVNKAYAMRPDLIAYAAYGSTENMELILKINGISNPFSIDENDIVIIPDKDKISSIVKPMSMSITDGDNTIRQ